MKIRIQKHGKNYKKEGKYSYYEVGRPPLVIYMANGGLSNFDAVASYFLIKDTKLNLFTYIHLK
jgi:hypothetical protein